MMVRNALVRSQLRNHWGAGLVKLRVLAPQSRGYRQGLQPTLMRVAGISRRGNGTPFHSDPTSYKC